jgi:hypothetical protein
MKNGPQSGTSVLNIAMLDIVFCEHDAPPTRKLNFALDCAEALAGLIAGVGESHRWPTGPAHFVQPMPLYMRNFFALRIAWLPALDEAHAKIYDLLANKGLKFVVTHDPSTTCQSRGCFSLWD